MPRFLTPVMLLGLALGPVSAWAADRPTAMSLFPAETVLFVRTADAGLLVERARGTAAIQMAADPALEPFVGSLRGSLRDAYAENAQEAFGVDFDELTSLPSGELAFAIVERANEKPGFVLLADFLGRADIAERLLDAARQRVEADGGLVSEEQLRVDKAVTLRPKNDTNNTIGVVRREAVFVAANDPALLASILDRWDGVAITAAGSADSATSEDASDAPEAPPYAESLNRNPAFANSLQECLAGRAEPPQAIGFVNPIALVRATNGQSTGVRLALASLPALGVDAFEGASAAVWLANDDWDTLIRGHLLIDNPRAGVAGIVRLQSGATAPQACIPSNIQKYSTLYVNPQQIFDDTEAVVDRFTYPGMFRERVKQRFSDNVGVDLPEDLLPVLDGRVSTVAAFEPDAAFPVARTFLVLGVNDEEVAQKLLDKAAEHQKQKPVKKTHGERSYYCAQNDDREDDDPGERRRRRAARPVAAVLDGSIVIGGSEEVLKLMMAAADGVESRLADSLQFKLVESRVRRLAGPHQVGLISYVNPEADLRHWLTLASKPETRDWLSQRENPVGRAVSAAVEAGDLPPVEDLLKYATPSGSLVYDTNTGLHYLSFRFRAAD